MRRAIGTGLLVLVAALGAAGCGGGDKGKSGGATTATAPALGTSTAPGATTTAPATAESTSPAEPGGVEEAARRLRKAGYIVSQLDVNPPATGARKVGDHVLMYEYKDIAGAREAAGLLRSAIADRRNRGEIARVGLRLYFLGQPRTITDAETVDFRKLVNTAEARKTGSFR